MANTLEKPEARFWYWVKERHRIHLRREEGEEKPWTIDEVLQNFFFTNPYREHDKVTRWFVEKIRDPLCNNDEVMFATVMFRWFNKIATGEILIDKNLHIEWSRDKCIKRLHKIEGPVFTGAYVIKSPDGFDKVTGICNCIQNIWRDRYRILDEIHGQSLEYAHSIFMEYPFLGGFMAYEIVTDLRHTFLLRDASDINTWCFLGPGATRGIRRILDLPPKGPLPKEAKDTILGLLQRSRRVLKSGIYPPFEMREIEHSLCEFDKFERIRLQDGKPKRIYDGQ